MLDIKYIIENKPLIQEGLEKKGYGKTISLDELEKLYRQCTKNQNILILNCPPTREGKLRDKDIEILQALKKRLDL